MRDDIEHRLHRVKITLDKSRVKCPMAKECKIATNCDRCNLFFEKCSNYKEKNK